VTRPATPVASGPAGRYAAAVPDPRAEGTHPRARDARAPAHAGEGTRSAIPVGRPRKGAKPDAAKVQAMRADGASWAQVASALGCTVASARRAA